MVTNLKAKPKRCIGGAASSAIVTGPVSPVPVTEEDAVARVFREASTHESEHAANDTDTHAPHTSSLQRRRHSYEFVSPRQTSDEGAGLLDDRVESRAASVSGHSQEEGHGTSPSDPAAAQQWRSRQFGSGRVNTGEAAAADPIPDDDGPQPTQVPASTADTPLVRRTPQANLMPVLVALTCSDELLQGDPELLLERGALARLWAQKYRCLHEMVSSKGGVGCAAALKRIVAEMWRVRRVCENLAARSGVPVPTDSDQNQSTFVNVEQPGAAVELPGASSPDASSDHTTSDQPTGSEPAQ